MSSKNYALASLGQNNWLTYEQLTTALTLRDLSDPQQGQHATQLILDTIVSSLACRWDVSSRIIRLSPIVSVNDNYDRLGFGADAVTRDRRYSRYISPSVMLRSHITSGIPAILDNLRSVESPTYDELLALPGLVYRRDSIDRHHVGEPHHLDLWRIKHRAGSTMADLMEMVEVVVNTVAPQSQWRTVASPHPYTVNGTQIDVKIGDEWLELAECGLISPDLLDRCGLDPQRWSGLALGMGLDRALMLRKHIPDIRMLRAKDPRIANQMHDLALWKPVSQMPPIRRDLSILVSTEDLLDAEIVGDRVKEILGDSAPDLESLEILADTPWGAMPEHVRQRIHMRPEHRNLLIRIVLRPIDRTLTDAEANSVRNKLYLALHEGDVLDLI